MAKTTKTILVCGFGPGISSAVAEKFGAQGFAVALVARNGERLSEGVKALQAKGVEATAFPADLADADAIPELVEKVRGAVGPIAAIHWSAYSGAAGDLLKASSVDLTAVLGLATTSLLATIQAALPDLKQARGGVLVTNGGLGYFDPKVDAMAVAWNTMGLAMANSAKHKMVGMLHQKLAPENVYVGEVVVLGTVKGTSFDSGAATIEPSRVADKFWALFNARTESTTQVG